MHFMRHVAAAGLAMACLGCATKVYVTELPVDASKHHRIDGVPFRMAENYKVKIYELSADKKSYKELALADKPTSFVNKNHVYLLHLSASTFSNGTVDFQLNDDNTIKSLSVNSTSTGESALTSLGKGVKDVLGARATRDKAEEAAAALAATQAETGVGAKEDVFVVALDAKIAAVDAQLELDALAPTASAVERQKAEARAKKARVLANQKARRAGIALPYPDEPFSA